ncbi:hypothetical protein BDQ17DRAFT_1437211 [Cyathus striatus]|nr:hypothetical protein BDQ17DRAFT_1437211 [Cyathus striatus]
MSTALTVTTPIVTNIGLKSPQKNTSLFMDDNTGLSIMEIIRDVRFSEATYVQFKDRRPGLNASTNVITINFAGEGNISGQWEHIGKFNKPLDHFMHTATGSNMILYLNGPDKSTFHLEFHRGKDKKLTCYHDKPNEVVKVAQYCGNSTPISIGGQNDYYPGVWKDVHYDFLPWSLVGMYVINKGFGDGTF